MYLRDQRRDPAVRAALAPLLLDERPEVHSAALLSLAAWTHDPAVRAVLLTAQASDDPDIRQLAETMLGYE